MTHPSLPAASTAERYFKFLSATYLDAQGRTAQPAKGRYIDALRQLHQTHRPRWDVSACLSGTQSGFSGKVWVWSDLHFSHENILRYCQRPFESAEAMNAALLQNCLARVTAQDLLIFGGDLTKGTVDEANRILRKIPAYKINVLGNHDIEKRELLGLAVDETVACLEFESDGRLAFMSHYPVSERILKQGQVNIHGHVHASALPPALGDGTRHINICVERTQYAPVRLDELLSPS